MFCPGEHIVDIAVGLCYNITPINPLKRCRMFDKLDAAENRYEEISLKLSDPQVIADQDEYRRLMKEFSGLEEIVSKYREYKKTKRYRRSAGASGRQFRQRFPRACPERTG